MVTRKPSPESIARQARAALKAKADPVRARGAERYFKETIKSYGVKAADIHALAAELYAGVKAAWTFDDAVALCDILVRDAELEAKAVGTLILNRFKRAFPPALTAASASASPARTRASSTPWSRPRTAGSSAPRTRAGPGAGLATRRPTTGSTSGRSTTAA